MKNAITISMQMLELVHIEKAGEMFTFDAKDKVFYAYMSKLQEDAKEANKYFMVTYEKIMQDLGVSHRTATRNLAKFHELGVISSQRVHLGGSSQPCVYTVHDIFSVAGLTFHTLDSTYSAE